MHEPINFQIHICFDLSGSSHARSPISFHICNYLQRVLRSPVNVQLSYNTGVFVTFEGVILLKNDKNIKTYKLQICGLTTSCDEPIQVTCPWMRNRTLPTPEKPPWAPIQPLHVYPGIYHCSSALSIFQCYLDESTKYVLSHI